MPINIFQIQVETISRKYHNGLTSTGTSYQSPSVIVEVDSKSVVFTHFLVPIREIKFVLQVIHKYLLFSDLIRSSRFI